MEFPCLLTPFFSYLPFCAGQEIWPRHLVSLLTCRLADSCKQNHQQDSGIVGTSLPGGKTRGFTICYHILPLCFTIFSLYIMSTLRLYFPPYLDPATGCIRVHDYSSGRPIGLQIESNRIKPKTICFWT